MESENYPPSADKSRIAALEGQVLELGKLVHAPPQTGAPLFYESDGLAIYGTADQCAKAFADLAKAKAKFKHIEKNKLVEVKKEGRLLYTYRYAEMTKVLDATEPALCEHGFSVLQPPSRVDGREISVNTLLLHKDGAFLSSCWKLNYAGDIKSVAGDLTMVQRYAYSKLLNLATDEDADEMAGESGKEERPQKNRQAPGSKGKGARQPDKAPPPADDVPPPGDEDAPPPEEPAPQRRPSARRAAEKVEPDPAAYADGPERSDEQMERIRELQAELGLSKPSVAKIVESETGINPMAPGVVFTEAAAAVTIKRMEDMVRERMGA